MKIKTKYLLSFGLIILLFLGSSLFTLQDMRENNAKLVELNRGTLSSTLALSEIQVQVLQIELNLIDAAISRLPGGVSEAEFYYQRAEGTLAIMIARATDNKDKGDRELVVYNQLNLLRDEMKDLFLLGVEMTKAFKERGNESGYSKLKQFDTAAKQINIQCTGLLGSNRMQLQEGLQNVESSFQLSLRRYLMISGVITLVGLFLAFLLSSVQTRQIKRMVKATAALADGDLSHSVAVRGKDEISMLAHNFQTAVENLRGIVGQTQDASQSNQENAGILSQHLEETVSAVMEIASNIQAIRNHFAVLVENISSSSSSVEQISGNVKSLTGMINNQAGAVTQTSASIEEMAASINNVANIAKANRQAAGELRQMTEVGGQKVGYTNEMIMDISHNIDDMLEMISIINSVAAKTNLLSMNAAIEAAHAGHFGRGFAVVADEIRQLAESTTSNSRKISTLLKGIIEKIQNALASSNESGEAFSKLNREVNEVVRAFEEISQSTDELSQGGREILTSATSLRNITEEIKSGSAEMQKGTDEINHALQSIKNISTESLQGINEISTGASEINTSVLKISELSIKNVEGITKLREEINRFRVEGGEAVAREEGLLDFGNARLKHREWLLRVLEYQDGKQQLSDEQITSNTVCYLGEWLASEGAQRFSGLEAMNHLEESHKLFHDKIREIVEMNRNGRREEAERQFAVLRDLSQRVLNNIAELEKQVRKGKKPAASKS